MMEQENKIAGHKKTLIIIAMLIGGLGLLVLVGAGGYFWGVKSAVWPCPKINNVMQSQVAPTPKPPEVVIIDEQKPSFSYLSLDRKYELRLYGVPDRDFPTMFSECKAKIFDQKGEEVFWNKNLVSDLVTCSNTGGEGEKLVFENGEGFLIYDFPNNQTEPVQFAKETGRFVARNNALDKWMLRKDMSNKTEFILADKEGKTIGVWDYPKFVDGYWVVIYDKVNDGFWIVTEFPNEEANSGLFVTRFDFLNAKTLELKIIDETGGYELYGRGCGGDSGTEFFKGGIVIKNSCITVPDDYKNKNQRGWITLNLGK